MAIDKRDDILRLAKGKASVKKIGSRKVAHRLRKFEWERLEVAKRKGFLKLKPGDRQALINTFTELMEAEGKEAKIVKNTE